MKIPYEYLDKILIGHLHSDDIGDLAIHEWFASRAQFGKVIAEIRRASASELMRNVKRFE